MYQYEDLYTDAEVEVLCQIVAGGHFASFRQVHRSAIALLARQLDVDVPKGAFEFGGSDGRRRRVPQRRRP